MTTDAATPQATSDALNEAAEKAREAEQRVESELRRIWMTWLFSITLTASIFTAATLKTIADSTLPHRGQLKLHEMAVIALTAAALLAIPEVVHAFRSLAQASSGKAIRVVLTIYAILAIILATLGGYGAKHAGDYSLATVLGLSIALPITAFALVLVASKVAHPLADSPRAERLLGPGARRGIFLVLAVVLIVLGGTFEWLLPFV